MKILITSGGTSERIDQVRHITNMSSGQTAQAIGKYLAANNHEIYFLHAARAQSLEEARYNDSFFSSDELYKKMKNILSKNEIDIVVHAAAVSDFVVDKVVINGELFEPDTLNKIDSSDEVEVILKRRSKIIYEIKSLSKKPNPLVIGFKLTNNKEPEDQKIAVLKLSESENVDFVVHNDLSEIADSKHVTNIYFKDTLMFKGKTKEELSKNIQRIIQLVEENKQGVSSFGGP